MYICFCLRFYDFFMISFIFYFSSRKSEEGLSITEEIEEDISIGSFAGSKVFLVAFLTKEADKESGSFCCFYIIEFGDRFMF